MRREEAIEIVERELDKEGRGNFTVKSYSNEKYIKLFRKFNYLKYVKRLPFLNFINFEKIISPDIEKNDPLVINERCIKDTSRFWIVPWNTNSIVNNYDINGGLVGPGSYLIEKNSKKLYSTGSGMIGFIKKIEEGKEIDEKFLTKLEVKQTE